VPTAVTHISWLDGKDAFGDSYWDRTKKWLDYYLPLREKLGFDDVILFDNGSAKATCDSFINMYSPHLWIFRNENIKRCYDTNYDYPYVWRFVWMVKNLFDNYDRVLVIDNDSFILSQRLATYVREKNSGWTSLYSPRHQMPECNLQIICRDAYRAYREFTNGNWEDVKDRCMETSLPVTVEHGFVADRFGETDRRPDATIDFFSQARLPLKVKFYE
jgi:hypothetical protein